MSDHESDSENTPVKTHKPRKTKYVEASEVRKKVKPSKKKREESSEDEAAEEEEPPSKQMSDEEPEEEEEKKESLIESGDDMEDAMVAAMEKQERKALKKKKKAAKKEEQPAKKQRVEAKSKASPPPSDSEPEEEKEAPSYNAFSKKAKQPAQKPDKKRKHGESDSEDDDDAQTKKEDEEQRSDKSDTESDDSDDEPSSSAAASSSSAKKFPFEANPADPNYTARQWSERNGLYVHFSQLVPTDNFTVTPAKNQGYSKSFFSVKCNKPQMFDFGAGSDFKKYKFGNETVVVGPFATTSHPRMWPYGDRNALPHSQFPPPKFNSGMKFKLPLFNHGFANNLTQEKKGVGLVDPSVDNFMQNWCRLQFDKWAKDQAWKHRQKMFPLRVSELLKPIIADHSKQETVYSNSQEEWSSYETALKEYEREIHDWGKVKKNKEPKPEKPSKPSDPRIKKKPDTSDSKKDSELQASWMKDGVNSVVLTTKDMKDRFDHINFAAPLLRNLTKNEREGGEDKTKNPPLKPNLPNDPFFLDAFRKPPMFENAKTKEMEPGFPMIPVDLPLWRCVTAEEAIHDKKRGYKNPSPHRLVPLEHRFNVSGDVLAPVFQIEHYDSKAGSGFRLRLLAVIWLGESGGLRTEQKPLPWDPVTKVGYDPATYYCIAQPYMRRKGKFDPETVENSKYESARTNDSQAVKYDPDADNLYGGYD